MNEPKKNGGELVVLETPVSEPEPKNTQALAVRSTFDIAPQQFQRGLDRRKKNRKALIAWVQEELKEGTDWGRIHVIKKDQCPDGKYCQNPYHFSKASLWKAGAEKICGMMGLKSSWPNFGRWEDKILDGGDINQILIRCELINDAGLIVSTGIGARAVKADYDDLNKSFKMAKKSSLIDAVLNCAGLSEIFTQDVEDMDPEKISSGSPDPHNPSEEPSAQTFPTGHLKPISTHCPIGKEWKGQPWELVDDGFLSWICDKIDDKPDLVKAAQDELRRRHVETPEAQERRAETQLRTGKSLADFAREIGDATNIDTLINIKDELPVEYEPGLRTYIASREADLAPQ